MSDSITMKTRATKRLPLPEANADIALAEINDLRALTRMSRSWIHDQVKAGLFPAPVIKQPRCTRWRVSDVRAWIEARIEDGAAEPKSKGQKPKQAPGASK